MVTDDDGVNYRDIAEIMTDLGYPMKHSAARNYIIAVMKKFAEEFCRALNITLDDETMSNVAKNPLFQSGVADILWYVEVERRQP